MQPRVRHLKPTPEHLMYLDEHLRAADRAECQATLGEKAEIAVTHSAVYSDLTWVSVDAEGTPICAYGLTLLEDVAVPWLLGTDEMWKYRRELVRDARQWVDEQAERFGPLENFVHADNAVHVRWLKHLGFRFDAKPYPLGLDGELFYRFYKHV